MKFPQLQEIRILRGQTFNPPIPKMKRKPRQIRDRDDDDDESGFHSTETLRQLRSGNIE